MLLLHRLPASIRDFSTVRPAHLQPDLPIQVRHKFLNLVAVLTNVLFVSSYNLRRHDVSIGDIAFHRASAVIVGVVWAALVSRYWWPIEARRELGNALGEYVARNFGFDADLRDCRFCLNIGWLYTRLVAFNSFENGVFIGHIDEVEEPSEDTALLTAPNSHPNLNDSITEFMAMYEPIVLRCSGVLTRNSTGSCICRSS